jgi:hypothetical protein
MFKQNQCTFKYITPTKEQTILIYRFLAGPFRLIWIRLRKVIVEVQFDISSEDDVLHPKTEIVHCEKFFNCGSVVQFQELDLLQGTV